MFSNVMDLKIAALNANPVPLHQVVMELEVPHVSCFFNFVFKALMIYLPFSKTKSVDATNTVTKNCPVIGEVVIIFVTQ